MWHGCLERGFVLGSLYGASGLLREAANRLEELECSSEVVHIYLYVCLWLLLSGECCKASYHRNNFVPPGGTFHTHPLHIQANITHTCTHTNNPNG
ncbi:hypothetical protein ILYODFUR_034993 [Ilyodon furcidens]|uniref:Uncharacterized protein n=1 Tax=Ilyodon furcidens TaxID=33524 RepID=A0ABV0UDM0_9TELE